MSQRILHPAWRDEYRPTPYPFGDWATLHNADEVFIPEGTFLDAAIYPIGGGPRLRLSRIVVDQQAVTLHVGDDSVALRASGQLDLLTAVSNIPLTDALGRPAGILVASAEGLAIFQTWVPGTYDFSFAQTGFAADVCLPVPETPFRGFLLDDGSIVTGDIWLVGDDGIVLSARQEEIPVVDCEEDTPPLVAQHVRVDVVGDPLFRQRLCAGVVTTPQLLKSVRFVRGCEAVECGPDAAGEIKLMTGRADNESTILRIRNVGGALRIETVGEVLQSIVT